MVYNNLPQQTPYYYPQYGYRAQQEVQPQVSQTQLPQNYLKGRPVASIDEAKASQIDLDGSLYVFPDLAHNKIYTKQISMDGTAAFNVYELGTIPEPAAPAYVTRDELNAVLDQFRDSLAAPVAAKTKASPQFNL